MIDITTIIQTAIANCISGLIANIVYIILFIWGVHFLGKKISELTKQIPSYIEQYQKIRDKQRKIDFALGNKR